MFTSNHIKLSVELTDLSKFSARAWNVKKKTIERNDYDVRILFYGNFRLFKMRLDGFLLCFLLGAIFTVLTPIEAAEEFGCPSNCHCSTDFTAAKCPGMEAFPVFNFSGSVQTL